MTMSRALSESIEVRTPRDPKAERIVLGACMTSPEALRTAQDVLGDADWYEPRHQVIWAAICAVARSGARVDPILVGNHIREVGALRSLDGSLAYLHTVYEAAPLSVGIDQHVQIVADLATRRRLHEAGQRIIQRTESGEGSAPELVEDALKAVRSARDERQGVEVLTQTWDDFVHSVTDERAMVIPGLLGVGDRCVLTGSGGLGKSTLLQQIAVSAAAGLQPFDWANEDPYDPVRVMVMDYENPDHRVKTRLWPLVKAVRDMGLDVEDRLTLGGHGNSFNLLNPQNALSLLRTVEHDKPDLLYIGPVYKMHNGDPDKEVTIKQVTDILDSIREMGVSLITEAHHTKGGKRGESLEPSGSNLWTWWPEFGLGLRLDADSDDIVRRCLLERWRMDREASKWPQVIEAGGKFPWARAEMYAPPPTPSRRDPYAPEF